MSYIPQLNISMNFEVWKHLIHKDTENSQVPKPNSLIKNNLNKLATFSKLLNILQSPLNKKRKRT